MKNFEEFIIEEDIISHSKKVLKKEPWTIRRSDFVISKLVQDVATQFKDIFGKADPDFVSKAVFSQFGASVSLSGTPTFRSGPSKNFADEHEKAVKKAIKNNKKVGDDVLQDYPTLKNK
jgi:hypothetical protein